MQRLDRICRRGPEHTAPDRVVRIAASNSTHTKAPGWGSSAGDPTKGHEIRGTRPVLVLSADAFNRVSGLLLVPPITQGGVASRETGFSVTLMGSGTKTQGVVLCDQTRTIDGRARRFRRVERAPAPLVEEALDAVRSILE